MSTIKNNPLINIYIPIEKSTPYLRQLIRSYEKQTYKNFKVYISSSHPIRNLPKFVKVVINSAHSGDVSAKRNLALKLGKGDIFIFNDDDVDIPIQYLENVTEVFKDKNVFAASGPLLTPPDSSLMQFASGAVWESYMGSLGAGVYRSRKMKKRIVYDYPAANLIFRKEVFRALFGFQKGVFPGEDTILCLQLWGSYKKGVFYCPDLYVYHHRKPLFKSHLQQIGRYGRQRGQFSLAYPKTSFKFFYFLPSLVFAYLLILIIYIIFGGPVFNMIILKLVLFPLAIYLLLIGIESISILFRYGFRIGFLTYFGIISTHIYYGFNFIKGFTYKIIDKLRLFRQSF